MGLSCSEDPMIVDCHSTMHIQTADVISHTGVVMCAHHIVRIKDVRLSCSRK